MFMRSWIFVAFLCLFLGLCPHDALSQNRSSRGYKTQNEKEYSNPTQSQTHWKSIAIILVAVLFLAAICYGTDGFYVCKLMFCKSPTKNKYTKMDLTSQV